MAEKDFYSESIEFNWTIKKLSTFEIQLLNHRFLKRIPKHLYKYRKSGEEGRIPFYVGERKIYTASLNNQNDIFEGVTPATVERIQNLNVEGACRYYKNDMISILSNRFPSLNKDLSEKIFELFLEKHFDKDAIFLLAKGFVKESEQKELKTVIAALVYLFKKLETETDENSDFAKGMRWLANANDLVGAFCMCDSCSHENLWAKYADDFKGYCIEYDLSDPCRSKGSIRFISSLYPVSYVEKKDDDWFKPLFESTIATIGIDGKGDKQKSGMIFHRWFIKTICSKNKERWSNENEWRVIGDANRSYLGPLVSAIIVGHNIDKKDFETIKNCAEKNDFPLKITDIDYLNKKVIVRELMPGDIRRINARHE